jgi:hypothetical protein
VDHRNFEQNIVCWIFYYAHMQHLAQYTYELILPTSPDHNSASFIPLSHLEADLSTIEGFLLFKSVALIAWLNESMWQISGNVLLGDGLPDTLVSGI